MAGMFHWIKIDWTKHPAVAAAAAGVASEENNDDKKKKKDLLEIEEEIFQASVAKGTLISKGSWFRAEDRTPGESVHVRTTFAAADPAQVQEAIRRLGVALREVFHLQDSPNGVNGMGNGVNGTL